MMRATSNGLNDLNPKPCSKFRICPNAPHPPHQWLDHGDGQGLSLRQAEDLIETGGELVDLLKLGFGTSLVTPNVGTKVKRYHEAGFDVYCGGTLFEAFYVRNEVDNYLRFIDSLGITCWKSATDQWSSLTTKNASSSTSSARITKCFQRSAPKKRHPHQPGQMDPDDEQ